MEHPKYKIALIVGAGEGLSASLARLLSAQGIRVALAARKIEKLGALCTETGARAYACNATEPDEVERLFGLVEREIGTPDLVVYNASGRTRGPIVDLVPADVAQAIAVSAYGGFLVAQQAAKRMLPNKHGAILFTGASASVKGYAQSASFAMGKFALRGLAQSMARELSPQGIHVAHFVIDGGIRSAARTKQPTIRIQCSIPTRLQKATGTCCSSRAAPGAGSWSCGRGWRSFEAITSQQPSLRAKRSNPGWLRGGRLDCFVASLLAMTKERERHDHGHHRRHRHQ
jgi:NAD(P)-dependent dehydrogenase (short-subunit alcohol dehydrogenase family)